MMSSVDESMPVLTFGTNPLDPDPEWATAERARPSPARGSAPTPAWFEFRTGGWRCDHPHPDAPGVASAMTRLPGHLVGTYALAHLNRYHPGWKLPCLRCGRPQWNTVGSLRCFGCR